MKADNTPCQSTNQCLQGVCTPGNHNAKRCVLSCHLLTRIWICVCCTVLYYFKRVCFCIVSLCHLTFFSSLNELQCDVPKHSVQQLSEYSQWQQLRSTMHCRICY